MAISPMFPKRRTGLPQGLDRITGWFEVTIGTEQHTARTIGALHHPPDSGDEEVRVLLAPGRTRRSTADRGSFTYACRQDLG